MKTKTQTQTQIQKKDDLYFCDYLITMKTKIKRILARFKIGNPINQLVYSSKEIEKMGLQKPIKRQPKRKRWQDKYIGKYAIQSGKSGRGIIVHKAFDTFKEAKRWGNWNYKKTSSWRIIKL